MTATVIKVDQTLFVDTPGRLGNCLAACVATILGKGINEIPHFLEEGARANRDDAEDRSRWFWLLLGYMAERGLRHVDLTSFDEAHPGEVVFVAGMSSRGVYHQVLYLDGTLWHDPHPSRDGVLQVSEIEAWRPL